MHVERFGVSTPSKLLSQFDSTIKAIGYRDRSKALQVAMRNFIADYTSKKEEHGVGAGAILFTYDHHSRGIQEDLTEIQHKYLDLVNSMTHVHLDGSQCLEMICVKGETKRIQELANRIMKRRGITQLRLSMVGLQ